MMRAITSRGVDNSQKDVLDHACRDIADLANLSVKTLHGKRIIEHHPRRLKADPVFGEVTLGLDLIPFELISIYNTTGDP